MLFRSIEVPLNVSLTMANDTFLCDFIENDFDENSPESIEKIKDYLKAYQIKNDYTSAFLISTKTGDYYHYKNGLDRKLMQSNEEDEWFYDFIESDRDYEFNVDNDQAKCDETTIFINCKIKNEQKKTVGVVGIGIKLEDIQSVFTAISENLDLTALLIDA